MATAVRVKICGITNVDDARAAVDAGADALGFNFFAGSARYIPPTQVAHIVAQLPEAPCFVGVFVNAARAVVADVAADVGLTAVQFHGDEAPALCEGWPQKVIKAIRVRDQHTAKVASTYPADFILADAHVEGQLGGTGTRIAVELLAGFERQRLILAGGLTADNVADAVRAVRPFGVDVASGVECSPGKKDWTLIRRFIANAHAA